MNNYSKIPSSKNKFLKLNIEKKEYNQYWFSEKTIEFIISQIVNNTKPTESIALLSCPSIFFSLEKEVQDRCFLFDIDTSLLKKHPNAVFYDFNDYSNIESKYFSFFDFILIDPPFIAKEPWKKYADFTKLIGKECFKVLSCSIAENEKFLDEFLSLKRKEYQPSIPNLVYQYSFYSNYDDERLNQTNDELK